MCGALTANAKPGRFSPSPIHRSDYGGASLDRFSPRAPKGNVSPKAATWACVRTACQNESCDVGYAWTALSGLPCTDGLA
jgi:hypothetical protein